MTTTISLPMNITDFHLEYTNEFCGNNDLINEAFDNYIRKQLSKPKQILPEYVDKYEDITDLINKEI